jgi:serine protease Do
MKRFLFARSNNLVVIALSIALGVSIATQWHGAATQAQPATQATRHAVSPDQKALLGTLQDAFSNIAEAAEPFVVTVKAAPTAHEQPEGSDQGQGQRPRRQLRIPQGDEDVPFGLPFDMRDFMRQRGEEGPDVSPSMGSGVIVRSQNGWAYVLTNNHVVRGRDRLHVELLDHSELPADLVGSDERSDLAMLKFRPRTTLPAGSVARLGDSEKARVGQWVMAIGSPLGYESTLTLGVISAKGRVLRGSARSLSSYTDLIQTDASINPGNSGGPLINIDGEVIGINTAIAPGPGGSGNIGIGFAIPSNIARGVSEQLIAKGKVTRGFLGVATSQDHRELEPELREQLRVDGGALVETVAPNTPAAKAGFKPGDVVIRFDGKDVGSFTDLENAVARVTPGNTVSVNIIRDGRPVELQVTVAERPAEAQTRLPRGGQEPRPAGEEHAVRAKFGLSVRPADGGVQVAQVTPGSEGDEAGLAPGDVITEVGHQKVASVADLQKALNSVSAGQSCVCTVKVPDGIRYVVIRP